MAVLTVGYTVSLAAVWSTTRMTPSGIASRYRGADSTSTEGPMQFGKSLGEMLVLTHTHLIGMATIFALTGLAVALCQQPSERWRRWLIGEPFVAILISFGSMWAMRYLHPSFAWVLEASSALMAVTFYVQVGVVAADLRRVSR